MTAFLTGLLLGIAGSGHCAAMCGPLVLAVERGLMRPGRRSLARHAVTYHLGRIATYVALALPPGVAAHALAVSGFERIVAIGAGLLLLIGALYSYRPKALGAPGAILSRAATRACVSAGRWSHAHRTAGPFVAGAANGFVPCGLVYAAVTAAAATGGAQDAIVLMLGFGLGTTPVLVALSLSATSLPFLWRARLRRLTPAVVALTGCLLIARGVIDPQHAAHHHAHAEVRNGNQ